jgi:trimeric autotransporter adhesin
MWMVFNASALTAIYNSTTPTSVSAFNGRMIVGQAASVGIAWIDMLSDEYFGWRNNTTRYSFTPIVGRNGTAVTTTSNYFPAGIVNSAVNDVAMTVLPNAPIDPATGLPVPTIAVATAGGVSVIKDDGTVVESLLCDTTSTYNTGWMNGNIKGAFLSDTDDTDLVGRC